MEQEFELETILISITGISCVDHFDKFFELDLFVFDDELINTM